MDSSIHTYKLLGSTSVFAFPLDSKLLEVKEVNGQILLYVESQISPDTRYKSRTFVTVDTDKLFDSSKLKYLATINFAGQINATHVFEQY